MALAVYRWDGEAARLIHGTGEDWYPAISHDWDDDNLPWVYPEGLSLSEREALFTASWEPGLTIVDLPTSGGSFRARMDAACAAASGPVILRLPEGVHELTEFILSGSSGDVGFAHGFYHPKLRGFLGPGPDKCRIRLKANSLSEAQRDYIEAMDSSGGVGGTNQLAFGLLQPTGDYRVYVAGVTFQAEDQQFMRSVQPGLASRGVIAAQPAPHKGVTVGPGKNATFSYVRWQAAGRACFAAPPFESANVETQRGYILYQKCELDGRRAPEIDPARPARCGPIMGNNEGTHEMVDCWLHHGNVSRYAVNDQNSGHPVVGFDGQYTLRRTKADHIGNGNIDPVLNGGAQLGGGTGAVCFGYESTKATIKFHQPIISVDNAVTSYHGQTSYSQHIGFAEVSTFRRQGGRAYIYGGTFRNTAWPILDGFLCVRVYASTYWWEDGINNTLFVYSGAEENPGIRKQPWLVSGAWPPNPATGIGMDGQPVSPATHYLVRNG